jgi:hypothetical protein
VARLPTVEAWKVSGRKLLWQPDGSLLWQWSRSTVVVVAAIVAVAAGIATVGIVGDCPDSATIAVDATEPQVGYKPCSTWEEHR